jgi:hypothetical protein
MGKRTKKPPIALNINPQIEELDREIEELEERVHIASEKRGKVLVSCVNKVLSTKYHQDQLAEGVHECSTSPSGTCVYDHERDLRWDNCLFCGDPYERK